MDGDSQLDVQLDIENIFHNENQRVSTWTVIFKGTFKTIYMATRNGSGDAS